MAPARGDRSDSSDGASVRSGSCGRLVLRRRVLYWGEGAKTGSNLILANSDPAVLRLFAAWVRRYLDPEAEFVLSMHLHEGNDERAAQRYWRSATGLPDAPFTKTFIKPRGTGHRKNHLEHGVCRVAVRRSTNHRLRVMSWIDAIADAFGTLQAVG